MIKIVKIRAGCGHGDGTELFQVMRVDHNEYVLKPVNGGAMFMAYIAHTFEDGETTSAAFLLTPERQPKTRRRR